MLLSCGMWSSSSEGKTELEVEMILYEVKCQRNGSIKLGVHDALQEARSISTGTFCVLH